MNRYFLLLFATLLLLLGSSLVSCQKEEKANNEAEKNLETTTEDTSSSLLSLPIPKKCVDRPSHFVLGNHSYFFSGNVSEHRDAKLNWLESRNVCREYCMDLISIESPIEDKMVSDFIVEHKLPYIWTSGRLCNFEGCDRPDLLPALINGWFWSGSGVKMSATDEKPAGWNYQPWSFTGHKTKVLGRMTPQPDNAEWEINESTEACMGVLNNIYHDGVRWHDIACYHTKQFICEDSDQLLSYVRKTNPRLQIK